jgi:hypothetical protein
MRFILFVKYTQKQKRVLNKFGGLNAMKIKVKLEVLRFTLWPFYAAENISQ